jgi:hypothetical protein
VALATTNLLPASLCIRVPARLQLFSSLACHLLGIKEVLFFFSAIVFQYINVTETDSHMNGWAALQVQYLASLL